MIPPSGQNWSIAGFHPTHKITLKKIEIILYWHPEINILKLAATQDLMSDVDAVVEESAKI